MATLAILISCMGLLGLAAITTEKKTKEIGIQRCPAQMRLKSRFSYPAISRLIAMSFVIGSLQPMVIIKLD
jgi:putative ABC transport system permease protein